jgi:hypothetical protein
MSDLAFWAVVIVLVLLFGRLVLALLRRYLRLMVLALLLVLVLTQCEGETRVFLDNLG